jgi:DNA helicase-2/ATP-dependent DNA helicase PcrA
VAMTRAEKRLYLTWARYRRRFGGGQPEVCLPSRFLNEVPVSLREKLSPYGRQPESDVDLFAEQYDVRESVKKNLYTGKTYNSVDNIAQFFAERGMPPPSGFTRRPAANSPAPDSPIPRPQASPAGTGPGAGAGGKPPSAGPSHASQPTLPGLSAAGPTPAKVTATTPSPAARVASATPTSRSLPARTAGNGQTVINAGVVVKHPKYGRGTVLRREGDGEDAKLTISFPGYGLKKIVQKYAGIKINE